MVAPKHQIKKADRLIGNAHLHSERETFYRALMLLMVGAQKRPVMIVDGSDVSSDGVYNKLRASVPVGGRAQTLYEEVHTEAYVGNRAVQLRFVQTLKRLLPGHCRPIVVTDAGFKNPWFKAVVAMGWDFVVRVGGHILMRPVGSEAWERVETVFATATGRAHYYGAVERVRNNPLRCHACTLKRTPTGRIKKDHFGKKSAMKHSLNNAHRQRTPWLLVGSLQGRRTITKTVMRLYQSTMQIEEAFRDLKNHRFGFAFRASLTRMRYRLENLLLIAALASLAAWLVGKAAEFTDLHRRYQANTVRTRTVLSTFYLGCQIIASDTLRPTRDVLRQAIKALNTNRYAVGLAN